MDWYLLIFIYGENQVIVNQDMGIKAEEMFSKGGGKLGDLGEIV
jgi:hypothetical protein